MSLFRPLVLSLAVVLSLTACNKNNTTDTPNADTTKAEATTKTTPTNNLDNSPTVLMMADTLKFGAWAYIHAAGGVDNANKEQLDCLFDADKTLFLEASKAEVTKMLSEDLIKQSDEFYDTEVGKKALKFMEQTQLQLQNKPIEGELVVMTDEDKAKVVEFSQSEAGQKLTQAANENTNSEALEALMKDLGEKEKARCKIS